MVSSLSQYTDGDPAPQRPEDGSAVRAATPTQTARRQNGGQPALSAVARCGVQTRLGGIFYVINLMQRFDLPECFEAICGLASTVGPWGTLEGLARAMLDSLQISDADRSRQDAPAARSEGHDMIALDPIWSALAQIDGRDPHARLGSDFECTLPVLAPDAWELALCEMHPQDAPPSANSLLTLCAPRFQSWLQAVAPAFGAEFEAIARPHDAREVLATPAMLHLTRTHVDIVMQLDAVCLPLRMAGLDFDPGWLPRWGRVIQFHYK